MFWFLLLPFFFMMEACRVPLYWAIFVSMTLIFSFYMQLFLISPVVVYNYVLLQEFLGLFFLLNYFSWLPFLSLLFKLGVSPFQYWVFYLVPFFSPSLLLWFLIFHKFVFLPLLLILIFNFSAFLFFGIFFVQLHFLGVGSFFSLIVLSSVESFRWLLLLSSFSVMSWWLLSISYMFSLFIILGGMSRSGYLGFPFIFLLVSFPSTINFILKYVVILFSVSGSFLLIAYPLFFLFISTLGLFYIFFVFSLTRVLEAISPVFYTFFLFLIFLPFSF